MVLVEDKKYKETLQILRGKKELSPLFRELKEWLRERFDVTAYNFVFERIKYNNPEGRFELYILLSSTADYNSMNEKTHYGYDKNKQEEISQKFKEIADKYDFGDPKTRMNVWVCYNDFSKEIKTEVNRHTCEKINKHIQEKYNDYSLWSIQAPFTDVVVFFIRDEDILKNTENGVCVSIRNDYFTVLKESDEFNVYNSDNFTMSFDSKENLDKNYEGNLYYYFK